MTYTQQHEPSYATVESRTVVRRLERSGHYRTLFGYVAVFHWPERKLHGLSAHLTNPCEHVHKSAAAAWACADKRVHGVRLAPVQGSTA